MHCQINYRLSHNSAYNLNNFNKGKIIAVGGNVLRFTGQTKPIFIKKKKK